jgi:hypothetical protein
MVANSSARFSLLLTTTRIVTTNNQHKKTWTGTVTSTTLHLHSKLVFVSRSIVISGRNFHSPLVPTLSGRNRRSPEPRS